MSCCTVVAAFENWIFIEILSCIHHVTGSTKFVIEMFTHTYLLGKLHGLAVGVEKVYKFNIKYIFRLYLWVSEISHKRPFQRQKVVPQYIVEFWSTAQLYITTNTAIRRSVWLLKVTMEIVKTVWYILQLVPSWNFFSNSSDLFLVCH